MGTIEDVRRNRKRRLFEDVTEQIIEFQIRNGQAVFFVDEYVGKFGMTVGFWS